MKYKLVDMTSYSRDGEWGASEAAVGLTECLVIRGTDFSGARNGHISSIPKRFIRDKILDRKRLQVDDIVIETAGGTKSQPTGRTLFVGTRILEKSCFPVTCASFSRFIRIDSSKAHPSFIFWCLQNLYLTGEIEKYQVQHTGVSRFQYSRFASEYEFHLPELSEQKAIASILSTLDDKIELNHQMNQTLEQLAQAIFKSWFIDFDPVRAKAEGKKPIGMTEEVAALFPNKFEETELGMIPKGWGLKQLGDVLELSYGKALKECDRVKGPYPVMGSNGQIGLHSEFLVNGPGIVVGRKGNPGTVVWVESNFYPIDTTFYVVPKSSIPLLFLYHSLCNQDLQVICADSAVPGLSRKIAYGNQIVIPPSNISDCFAGLVRDFYAKIQMNNKLINLLSELRNTLLPKLISGEIRVKQAEKLISEVV